MVKQGDFALVLETILAVGVFLRRTKPGLASRAVQSHAPKGEGWPVGHLFEVKHGSPHTESMLGAIGSSVFTLRCTTASSLTLDGRMDMMDTLVLDGRSGLGVDDRRCLCRCVVQ